MPRTEKPEARAGSAVTRRLATASKATTREGRATGRRIIVPGLSAVDTSFVTPIVYGVAREKLTDIGLVDSDLLIIRRAR